MWWCLNIGAFFCIVAAVPALPWRYSKVDTNVGNRFVMERYYNMMGCTNNMGKTEGWFAMRKKLQRKTEEFGRPSPITAIMGTVTQSMGTGGAAMGCAMWQKCKEHVNQRFMSYTTMAYTSLACMIFMALGSLMAVGTGVFLGMEQASAGKKKKKKKDDECMEPSTKTMTLGVFSFMFTAGGVGAYTCVSGNMLKDFQTTAYYPYAGAHAGPFCGGFGAFLIWIGLCVAINRVYQCCGKKKEAEGADGEMGGGGGYGYPPPGGGYGGPPPGAYGQQGW